MKSIKQQIKRLPIHIAIVPDGNGRWAEKKGLPRTAGHAEGIKRIREIIQKSSEMGIKVLTLYIFSTENWKRKENEVQFLMRAPINFLTTDLLLLVKKNIRVRISGKKSDIPNRTEFALREFEEKTSHCTGMILNLAFNYGSRNEIVQAFHVLFEKVQKGIIKLHEIDEAVISNHLYTRDLPDPDLLIRTSGERRLSNFLLWQSVYTEFWFTDRLWPDFTIEQFEEAIKDFQHRNRRYGAY
jgi:undecaprenyl diphosphate synthase